MPSEEDRWPLMQQPAEAAAQEGVCREHTSAPSFLSYFLSICSPSPNAGEQGVSLMQPLKGIPVAREEGSRERPGGTQGQAEDSWQDTRVTVGFSGPRAGEC